MIELLMKKKENVLQSPIPPRLPRTDSLEVSVYKCQVDSWRGPPNPPLPQPPAPAPV
jgi:hypothetical protein